ncbi:MAG: hypothetical protein MUF47_14125 [Porphyrobacter sp.]|jgi:hypothetical protein|nr:hypothetical protein [Porphyrobacter sp.]
MNLLRGAALLLLPFSAAAQAQAIKSEPPMKVFTAAEIEAVAMPELAYTPNTSFDQAYADITECDSLASGISFYMGADSAAMAGAGFAMNFE